MTAQEYRRARKRFGQNFLTDASYVDRIIDAVAPEADDLMIEVGPGRGALTDHLLRRCPSLHLLELDRDLVQLLRDRYSGFPQFQLHQGDALNFDFSTVGNAEASIRVVGNLPYNISTPLLFHLLAFGSRIRDMHFMLQKEVVDRLAAQPGTRAYGRLGVMAQYHCRVEPLFEVPPGAFWPAPSVVSAFVRLRPHEQLPAAALNPAFFARLVNTCFQQRRKILRNPLKQLANRDTLAAVTLDLGRRPETLTVAEFVDLSNQLRPKNDKIKD